MDIVVFGSNGQLGQSLMDVSFNYPQHNMLFTDIDTVDIRKYQQVLNFVSRNYPTVLINCAAYTGVDDAERFVDPAKALNTFAVENLAKIAAEKNVFLVHVSTDYIYDGKQYKPYKETGNVHPVSTYGRTKWKGEVAVMRSGCRYAIIRTSWLYSEYGNNFVKTMLQKSEEQDELKVVYDQIGTPTYARDLAEAIMQIVSQNEQMEQSETFHYSNEGIASWYDFAVEIMRLAQRDTKIIPILTSQHQTIAKRPLFTVLDKQKIKSQYDITIPHWRDSLEKCMKNIL